MNKKVISKDVVIENDKAIVTEKIESIMDSNTIELKLRELNMRKIQIKEQNKKLVEQYNKLSDEENELKALLSELTPIENIEVI
jgi:hypothetical protein